MKKFLSRVCGVLLIASIGLNLFFYVERSGNERSGGLGRIDEGLEAVDRRSGVRVKWIGESFVPLPASGKLTLQDLVGEFGLGEAESKATVYSGYKDYGSRKPKVVSHWNYHQISWSGAAADYLLELNAGDEVHFDQIRPAMHRDYDYRVTDLRAAGEAVNLGQVPIPYLRIGRVLFADEYTSTSDSSNTGTYILELTAEELRRVEVWLGRISKLSAQSNGGFVGGYVALRHEKTAAEQSFREWVWPVGSDHYRITGGDYSLQIWKDPGNNVILCMDDDD